MLSIGIVGYNQPASLQNCLASIYRYPPAKPFEVIYVDNSSTAGNGEMVQKDFPEVRVLAYHRNLGFARANNLAFQVARGEYFLMLNSDIEVHPGALDEILGFSEKNPRAGLVTGRLLNSDGSLQYTLLRDDYWSLKTFISRDLGLTRFLSPARRLLDWVHYRDGAHNQVMEVEGAWGACLAVRREAWEELGGLDERFFFYSEDIDLCFRARLAGWKIFYLPEAVFTHHRAQSTAPLGAWAHVQLYQSMDLFLRKHKGAGYAALARLIVLSGALKTAIASRLLGSKGREGKVKAQALLMWAIGRG